MDFKSFKRRDLQSLCKLNKLPANTTNAAMADSLASLPTVEGLEEFLGNLDCELQGSPERSVIPKSDGRRTTTRQKAVKEELECSHLVTRTRCKTRTKAVEGTNTRKTPATQTTRKRASQEASIQKRDKDLQAEFEAGMDQSQIYENNVLPEVENQDISEEVSGASVENEQLFSESQSEAQNAVNHGQEVIDVDDCEKNKEEDHINDMQAEDSEKLNDSDSKVDYHSLSRKELQNLCKKNKIPANMTNAAMAEALEALESLEFVEGLQEFVKGCDSQALSSPVSGISSSCARRSRTTQKITKEEPRSSKLITKSCRGSRRRIIEETIQGKDDVPTTPAAPTARREATQAGSALYEIREKDSAVHKSELKKMENLSTEISEVSGVAEFNNDMCSSNNNVLGVENSKEPVELDSQVVENVVEEEVLESAEVSKVSTDLEKVDIGPEVVASYATQQENLEIGSGDDELESIEVQPSNNLEIDADSESEDGQLESPDNVNADDQKSNEVVYEFSTQADQLICLEMKDESKLGNGNLEKAVNTSQADKPSVEHIVQSGGCSTKDEIIENSDSEATSQDDHLSMEVNVESESEEIHTEDNEMFEKFGFEATSQDVHSMEVNVATESEDGPTENEMSKKSDDQISLEINMESKPEVAADSATDSCWVEKPGDGDAQVMISNKFNLEAIIPADSCRLTEKDLYETSLRKLKMLYKEKLQKAKLAKKMENLTLKETEIPLAKLEEDLQECLMEFEEGVVSPFVGSSGNNEHSIVVPPTIPEDEVIEDHFEEPEEKTNAETTKLCPVDILLDNEVTFEDAVTGNINVVTCVPQSTPSKCSSKTKKPLLPTPSKSSSMSVGNKGVLIENKENIDSSVSKNEPGKIKIVVSESVDILSPLSMAKLKRDIKLLKQQSETKKQALQPHPKNLLASP